MQHIPRYKDEGTVVKNGTLPKCSHFVVFHISHINFEFTRSGTKSTRK